MADRLRTRGSVRTAVVWQAVRASLAELVIETGREQLDVLDAGGGTGGFAVPLAELGHRVTVVDASPDSLAALERRAVDAGVTERIAGLQGDVASLLDVVPGASFDVVILHSVLDLVDDPAAVLGAVAVVVRPHGAVSVLATNRLAAVLHRAASGRFDEALHALRDPLGRYAATDPAPRRFGLHDLERLMITAGFQVVATHGSRIFVDLVPGGLLDVDPAAVEALIALEIEASQVPALRDIATQLHLVGRRM
jgi:S-adenosylmethionine-dependent methyltransferase